ncbi:hypothetical protein ES703_56108 [subsurface metagenome]
MNIKFIVILLSCMLLLSGFAIPTVACPPPDCGDCKEWDPVKEECVLEEGAECATSLDCTICYSCVNCSCEYSCVDDQCCDFILGCVGKCPPCHYCDNGFCYDICVECQECVEGSCISCAALGKVCCDGWCEEPCTQTDGDTCDTGHSLEYQCIGCVVLPYHCDDFTTRVYTGNVPHQCSGGCFGDCDWVNDVHCYTEYECGVEVDFLAICSTDPEEPGGVRCNPFPGWECSHCIRNIYNPGENHYVTSGECQ